MLVYTRQTIREKNMNLWNLYETVALPIVSEISNRIKLR